MRVDWDAAAVVGHRKIAVGLELHFDPGGVAGDGLVHGVVHHLREEMVHRLLVGAADIHAGPTADGLQPFQHLNVGGGVARRGRKGPSARRARGASARGFTGAEEKRSSDRSMRAMNSRIGKILPIPPTLAKRAGRSL